MRLGDLLTFCWASDLWEKRNLVHIEIPPDEEVSRVSGADLFLEHIG